MTDNPRTSIADRLFDASSAEADLEEQLSDAGVTFTRLGWDHYDCSVEIYGVPNDYRLSLAAQRVIHAAGFMIAYVNHEDRWETHYRFKSMEFVASKGWRVSYPHKREDGQKGILVEEIVPNWPKEWFENGKVLIVAPDENEKSAPPAEASGTLKDTQ